MCCYERCLCVYQTINDEVDGAVDGDEEVVGLSERMILVAKMLK